MRSDMDHTVILANYTMPAFTPQPQSITALSLVVLLRPLNFHRHCGGLLPPNQHRHRGVLQCSWRSFCPSHPQCSESSKCHVNWSHHLIPRERSRGVWMHGGSSGSQRHRPLSPAWRPLPHSQTTTLSGQQEQSRHCTQWDRRDGVTRRSHLVHPLWSRAASN